MENLDLFYEIFNADLPRQGPGDNFSTRKAYSYLDQLPPNPDILDVGCGSGMQTLELARLTYGKIIAIDNYQPYLDKLENLAKASDVIDKITILNRSMLEMDFEANSFDIIWSEGAMYIYGVEKALQDWPFFIKQKGYLVFSELCWFKENPPEEIHEYLMTEYPVMNNLEENIEMIKSTKGLDLLHHFKVPESSWWDNYYLPLEKSIQNTRKMYRDDEETLKIFEMINTEIEMFRKYSDFYGYEFFILRT